MALFSLRFVFVTLLLLTTASAAMAEPTEIAVRVLSKGAKFIGTSLGGAQVTLRDVDTGELLASGVTAGTTGDTERIMHEPRTQETALHTEDAAEFRTTIDLDRPRLVEVTALGPLAQRQASNRVSATQWVVPGKHITGGDAWLLEMPGLVVDVLAPPAHTWFPEPRRVELRANVMMMCGCPLGPDTPWHIRDFEIQAIVKRDGQRIDQVPLHYAGSHSQFSACYDADAPGTYEAIIYAYQPGNGNTGLDRVTWMIGQ